MMQQRSYLSRSFFSFLFLDTVLIFTWQWFALPFAGAQVILKNGTVESDPPVDFTTEIRPILSAHCFACHGPEEESREGGIRFDTTDGAFVEGDSGEFAIVAGNPKASELVRRILSSDSSEMMPPANHQKSLSKKQKDLLFRWISHGPKYQDHWSFLPLTKPEIPIVSKKTVPGSTVSIEKAWQQNPIDRSFLTAAGYTGHCR